MPTPCLGPREPHRGLEPPLGPSPARRLSPLVLAVLAAALLAACGGDDDAHLSAAAREGKAIAADSGCTACHGNSGEGGVGPAWAGLYGATVLLDDGSSVVASDDYLRQSITEPDAQRVDGFNILMPPNTLSDEQIDDVIAYIRELE